MTLSPSFYRHSASNTIATFVNVLAHVYPSAINLGKVSLSPKQQEKADLINSLIEEIKPSLGLERVSVNLIIDSSVNHNASIMGSSSALGGPVLSLGKEYFKYFNSSYSKTHSFRKAQLLLQKLPDHPLEMGKYLDSLHPQEAATVLKIIHSQFSVLSTKELKGILAHELGHAKQHHSLRSCGVLATMLYIGALSLNNFKYIPTISPPELNSAAIIGSFFLVPAAVLATFQQFSRIHEYEADKECGNKLDTMQGIQSFFKRLIIREIIKNNFDNSSQKNPSYYEQIKQKLDSWEYFTSHPHPAKRMMQNYLQMNSPTKPSRYMAISSMISTAIGTTFLTAQVAIEAFATYYSLTHF